MFGFMSFDDFYFYFYYAELMILGFISLFLTVTQNGITKICAPVEWVLHMLPCSLGKEDDEESKLSSKTHFQTFFSSKDVFGTARRLLGDDDDHSSKGEEIGYCAAKVLKSHVMVLYILFNVLNCSSILS